MLSCLVRIITSVASLYYNTKLTFSFKVLEIHLRTMHADKNGQMIVCKMCNVVFGTLVELESHSCSTLESPSSTALSSGSQGGGGGASTGNGSGTGSGDLDPTLASVTSVGSRLSMSGMRAGFPCDNCTMEFMSMENLQMHKEKSHKVKTVFNSLKVEENYYGYIL